MSFVLSGIDQARRQLQSAPNLILSQAGEAIREEAEEILAAADPPIVTGNLASTGVVSEPYRDGDTIAVDVAYGGPKAPYAVFVHESRSGRGYKFLEKPLRAAVKGMLGRLAKRIHV